MTRIGLVLTAIVLLASLATAGDMAKSGQWGIQSSLGLATSPVFAAPTVGLKFMASENMAIRAELGFASYSPAGGGGSTSGYEIGAGFEYHMESKGGNVSPYVGAGFGYGGGSAPGGGTTPTAFSIAGFFGGEYFFSSNFSWAGQVGLGFTSAGASGATSTAIGTASGTFIMSWYLF